MPLVDRDALGAGARFAGPVILSRSSTPRRSCRRAGRETVHETGAILLTAPTQRRRAMTRESTPRARSRSSPISRRTATAFIERVMDYVRHPSISAHNIGIREVAALLVEMLKGLGMEARGGADRRNHPMVLGTRRRIARQADRAALRPLRRAAAGSAGAVDQPALRADHPRRPHLCARHRRQQGPAFRPDAGDRIASGRPRRRCPATSSSCSKARRRSAARTSPIS